MPLSESDLSSWYDDYAAADRWSTTADCKAVKAVKDDILDTVHTESQIQRYLSATHVSQGFCLPCQHLLDHWPDTTWRKAVVARHFDTYQVEAAARNGCGLCALIFWILKRNNLINTFRKIEARLRLCRPNHDTSASLSVQDRVSVSTQHYFFWFNYPGKESALWRDPNLESIWFYSKTLSPAGVLD